MGQGGTNSHKSGTNEDKCEHTLHTCSLREETPDDMKI